MYSFRLFYRTCYHKRKLFPQSILIKNYPTVSNIDNTIHKSGELKFFSHLDIKLKRFNRIFKKDIEKTLKIMQPENANDAAFLLGCFGNEMPDESFEQKRELSKIFIECLEKNGLCMTIKHYNTLLKSLIENGSVIDHTSWLQNLSSKSLEPDIETFQHLLTSAANHGNIIAASDIIEKIKLKGYFLSSSMYNKLIQASAASGNDTWRDLMNSLKKIGFTPSFETYISAMVGFSKCGNIKSVQQIYDEEIQSLKPIDIESVFLIIDTLVESNHPHHISQVIKWLNVIENPSDQSKVKLNLVQFIHKKQFKIVLSLLNYLPEEDIRFDITKQLLQEMIICDHPIEEIFSVITYLTEIKKEKLKTEIFPECTISRAIYLAYKFKKYETARSLLVFWQQKGEILRPHYFWPLLIAYGNEESQNGIVSILNLMNDLRVTIDTNTLIDFVLPNFNNKNVNFQINTLRKYVSSSSPKDLITPITAGLLRKGDFINAIKLCSFYKYNLEPEFLITPLAKGLEIIFDNNSLVYFLKQFKYNNTNIDWTGILLLKIIFNNKIKLIENGHEKLFNILRLSKLPCSSVVANFLAIKLGSKAQNLLIDWNLQIPSKYAYINREILSLNHLESHITELKGNTIKLTTPALSRKLLLAYCHGGDFKNASIIFKEYEKKFGFKNFTINCLISYFNILIINENLNEAEELFKSINRDFPLKKIDKNKLLNYATLLVKNGRVEDALTFLKDNINTKVYENNLVLRNYWNLLNAVSDSTSPEAPKKLNEIFQLLCSFSFINLKESNKVLGPLVRIHLNRKDYEKAVETYEYWTKHYKKAPLQQELIHTLVNEISANKSDVSQLLNRVIEATIQVFGLQNTLATLAVVFALEGQNKTLVELLKNNGKEIYCYCKPMYFKCKLLAQNGCADTLNNLLEAFIKRGAEDVEEIQFLLEFIFEAHKINKDREGVINLWTRIRKENLIIDDYFRKRLKYFIESDQKQKSISLNS